jgi:hypothetical protein
MAMLMLRDVFDELPNVKGGEVPEGSDRDGRLLVFAHHQSWALAISCPRTRPPAPGLLTEGATCIVDRRGPDDEQSSHL